MNSRKVEGVNVFHGEIGISSSVNRCGILQRSIAQCVCDAMKKLLRMWKGRRELVAEEGDTAQAEGENHIKEIKALSFHPQEVPV